MINNHDVLTAISQERLLSSIRDEVHVLKKKELIPVSIYMLVWASRIYRKQALANYYYTSHQDIDENEKDHIMDEWYSKYDPISPENLAATSIYQKGNREAAEPDFFERNQDYKNVIEDMGRLSLLLRQLFSQGDKFAMDTLKELK